jgi:hypothetical protein
MSGHCKAASMICAGLLTDAPGRDAFHRVPEKKEWDAVERVPTSKRV